jgi:hypothetical protein
MNVAADGFVTVCEIYEDRKKTHQRGHGYLRNNADPQKNDEEWGKHNQRYDLRRNHDREDEIHHLRFVKADDHHSETEGCGE